MPSESFKPIAVRPPSDNPLLFRLRCLVDLQLGSIVKQLRPALAAMNGRVLDVGAGESPWREWLPADAAYHGIDIGHAADFGMHAGRQDITYYDGTVMPFDDAAFDGAICIEVLEHARDPELCLSEIARVLKDRAPVLLSVPWSARRHHVPHDYHRFTRERLDMLFRDSGFEDIEISERGTDLGAIASKLVVLCARLVPRKAGLDVLWKLPLALLCAPLTLGFLGAAHVSERFGWGAKEDPLGYFVKARRAARGRDA
jgi:SAM-dependent methyltransferase